jgi:predicted CopG family antitoxin
MTKDREAETQQFEQVLSRLDALLKRKHGDLPKMPATPDTPVFVILPPSPAKTTETPAPEQAGNIDDQEPALPGEGFIPVLTEVYEGILPLKKTPDSYSEATDALIEALLPAILDIVERATQEESLKMQQALSSRLLTEMALALRQRLLMED